MKDCIEVVTCKLVAGVETERFLEASNHLSSIMPRFKGFKSRTTAYDADRETWIDMITWASREDALAAAEQVMSLDECTVMFAMLDESSIDMHHYETV